MTPSPQRSCLRVLTKDGVALWVDRVHPVAPKRGSVLMVHGLGANRLTFDFPQRSLATYLARRGWDCFVAELRGTGRSDHPAHWDIAHYLDQDLPALVEAVQHAGDGPLFWIGHSMGGILLLNWWAERGEAAGVSGGITVGSAADYRVGASGFRKLAALRRVLEPALTRRPLAIPWHHLTRTLSPMVGNVRLPLEDFNLWRGNMEVELCRQLMREGFGVIPTPLLQSLATTFDEAGFQRPGQPPLLTRLSRVSGPLMVVAGTLDAQCPPEAALHTARLLPQGEAWVVGREYGQADDYGHFDLVLGVRAPREVWPRLGKWLAERVA